MTLRFGIVGLDSPHASSFARLLNNGRLDERFPARVRVSAAWANEPSSDFALSIERQPQIIQNVVDLGVPILPQLSQLNEHCDAFLLVAVDVRTHPVLLQMLAPFGKPVYVDTRLAPSLTSGQTMLALAASADVTLHGGSPKRFAESFTRALAPDMRGLDLWGPMPIKAPFDGVAWYGVHMIDMAVAAMGVGCVSVRATRGEHETFELLWQDGRTVTIRALPNWGPRTGGVVHDSDGSKPFEVYASDEMLLPLLASIIDGCVTGQANVPGPELAETVAIIEAANRARRDGNLADVVTP